MSETKRFPIVPWLLDGLTITDCTSVKLPLNQAIRLAAEAPIVSAASHRSDEFHDPEPESTPASILDTAACGFCRLTGTTGEIRAHVGPFMLCPNRPLTDFEEESDMERDRRAPTPRAAKDYSVFTVESVYSAAKHGDDAALAELDRRRGYHIGRESL